MGFEIDMPLSICFFSAQEDSTFLFFAWMFLPRDPKRKHHQLFQEFPVNLPEPWAQERMTNQAYEILL